SRCAKPVRGSFVRAGDRVTPGRTPGRRARCNESRFPPSARSCEYCTLAAERRKVVFRTPILAGSLVLCAAALCGQDVIGARAGAVLFTGGGVFVNGNP